MLSGASNTIGELKMNGGTFGVSQLAREEATAKVGKLTGTRGSINLLHSTLTLTGTDNTISRPQTGRLRHRRPGGRKVACL